MSFADLVTSILGLIQSVIYLIIGASVVVFILGIIKMIAGGANEKSLSDGKQRIIWGIIGIFVSVSVWGLIRILLTTFSLS